MRLATYSAPAPLATSSFGVLHATLAGQKGKGPPRFAKRRIHSNALLNGGITFEGLKFAQPV